jgi:hypothetical protein
MPTNIEGNQDPRTPEPQPSAPIAKMLSALDELLEATKRVAVELRNTSDHLPDQSLPSIDSSPDSR